MWVDKRTTVCNTYGNISGWDTSNVYDMSSLFAGLSTFNDDISSWNVEGVTNMRKMFDGATKFNSNLSSWNVSGVSKCYRFAHDAPNITCPNFTCTENTSCPKPSP